jgi:probable FeS assembly SUF system protein SufT
LKRDCEAVIIPVGERVTLQKGEQAFITQTLGGSYTVVVNGNMFRIDGQDADALGLEPQEAAPAHTPKAESPEELEKQVWEQMRTCYDPEIPVNIVDLGLIYDCQVTPLPGGEGNRVEVKMTLTAPGCGMGDYLRQDVQNKLLCIEGVEEAEVELVWEPQWNQSMMSEAAQLQLGMM